MISSFDSILLVIYIIIAFAVAMAIIYLVFKGMTILLDKLMMLLLSKTTLDVEACSMIMAVISTIVFGIIVLLIWLAVNNILL
ncbi:hypothetical protein [Staphylococcus phage Stab21]|jgi:uncharacterized protein YhhL (DUF1145 family)|uniref:MbpY n=21 Tax=Kayvirus TaxID=1857843 RepID=V5XW45_BPS25|nr:hypothetical protein [Staphylococcus aureus]YP_008854124.1 hypothetical protein X577_gp010 [Staphylococcus phage S25-4]YP_008854300.1 hypothetical protein X600_gp041 [Staphylococcus phage S25-3]YP_009041393.1 hypothetical protein CPT_phageK_gp095 [Staphylococcus phage K]YP_009098315.1 hypothetical protein QLX38_gp070 [Staphylococcus phage Team1]YP_009224587.1 hypothetical protein ST812_177 [Staphylococcus phage 812]YP_009780154.1 hypothetical protein QLX23_gp093 [Staphylococcus phage ISP]